MKLFKSVIVFVLFLTTSCSQHIDVPHSFVPQKLDTGDFVLAAWTKDRSPYAPVKIYIEGDGASFNAHGQPTGDPTPKGTLLREIAFQDYNPNVVYLARPCQFYKGGICRQKYWTTARFAPEVVEAMYKAVKQLAQGREIILIGFSGGGQIVGLLAATKPDLRIKKVITLGGNLDHETWTKYHKVPALDESLNLTDYLNSFCVVPQRHFVGNHDTVIPPSLMIDSLKQCYKHVTDVFSVVGGASHSKGWESIYPLIWAEK